MMYSPKKIVLLLTASFVVGAVSAKMFSEKATASIPDDAPVIEAVPIERVLEVGPLKATASIPDNAPVIEAVPVQRVFEIGPLPEPFPWEETKGTILDCEQERQSERIALACNIYHEARGETLKGQVAVALVTRNRVKSEKYPDSYSEVVWEIRRSAKTKRRVAQFSWALDGKHDRIYDIQSWRTAWEIAGDVIAGKYKDFTNGSLWYHAKKVKPVWRKKFEVAAVIGEHIFYRKK